MVGLHGGVPDLKKPYGGVGVNLHRLAPHFWGWGGVGWGSGARSFAAFLELVND